VDERFSKERAQFGLPRVRRPVAKSNRRNKFRVVLQLDQAAVADGNAEDIRGQVFQGREAIPPAGQPPLRPGRRPSPPPPPKNLNRRPPHTIPPPVLGEGFYFVRENITPGIAATVVYPPSIIRAGPRLLEDELYSNPLARS